MKTLNRMAKERLEQFDIGLSIAKKLIKKTPELLPISAAFMKDATELIEALHAEMSYSTELEKQVEREVAKKINRQETISELLDEIDELRARLVNYENV